MDPYRSDRVVRALTALVTVAYYLVWVAVVLIVVVTPLMQLKGEYGTLDVPVRVDAPAATLVSDWDPQARGFELDHRHGELEVRLDIVPVRLRLLSWFATTAMAGLALLFVHQLRRLFVRVRDGAPFDADNARRLRSMGIVLLVLQVIETAYHFWAAVEVTRALDARSSVDLGASLDLGGGQIFMAFVLIALAEIFRRGSQLEHEQSLVV
jgi:hypothetical protein